MTRYIAIDGMGGSGKTYLSEILAQQLGASVHHLDEYGDDYKPFIGLPQLLTVVQADQSPIVIYEGVGVFDARFDALKPFRILVQVPEEIKLQRATSRDVPRDDRSEDDWREIWQIWLEAERQYFTESTVQKADIIVGRETGDFDVDKTLSEFHAWSESRG